VFLLNGQKVKKTEVYKKNLNPTFTKDELFVVPVPSRTAASFRVEVFDWDQIGKDTLLGTGEIPLAGDSVESFGSKEIEIPISGSSGGDSSLRLRLMWQPELLAKKKTRTGFLGSTTRAFTGAPTAAFGAGRSLVGGGAQAAGGAIGAGGKALTGGANALGGGVNALGSGLKSGMGFLGGKQKNKSQEVSPQPSSPAQSALGQVPLPPITVAPPALSPTASKNSDDNASLSSITTPVLSQSTGSFGKYTFFLTGTKSSGMTDFFFP
jgi:Ca2+-dependent lipid-binding protein